MSSTRPAGPLSISDIRWVATSRVSMGWNRTPLIANTAGDNRWAENVVLIRSWNCVARTIVWPSPDVGECLFDAQLGLVIGKRHGVDPDDRHVDDVVDAGAARGGDEVVGGDDVLAAGALRGAMNDRVDALQCGVDAGTAE